MYPEDGVSMLLTNIVKLEPGLLERNTEMDLRVVESLLRSAAAYGVRPDAHVISQLQLHSHCIDSDTVKYSRGLDMWTGYARHSVHPFQLNEEEISCRNRNELGNC
jgi:hypothetical protein